MSLEDIGEIYRLYENALEKRFATLRKDVSRSKTQKPQSDTALDVGSIGLNSYNYVKVLNDHYNIKLHDLGTSEYFPATEPDYDVCKMIITTDHSGYWLHDDAQITTNETEKAAGRFHDGQGITCKGEPKLVGGFDRGYGDNTNTKKRQALYFNRTNSPTQWKDYIVVENVTAQNFNKTMRITDSNTLSWLFRVKMDEFATNGSTLSAPRLLHFIEDGSDNNHQHIRFGSGGEVQADFKKGGTRLVQQTTATFSTNTDYEIWVTYDHLATPKFHIIVNGTDQTLSTPSNPALGSAAFNNIAIGRRGLDDADDGGYIKGYLILVKHFRQIISPTEANQHFTNKLTIANIAYGKVATAEESVPRNL